MSEGLPPEHVLLEENIHYRDLAIKRQQRIDTLEQVIAYWEGQSKLRGPRQHFSVPNNIFGRIWLHFMKRWLNKKSYAVQVRGRSPKTPKGRSWAGDVDKKQARRLGIYLNNRTVK